jgi:ATP-dependent RNA helicase DeaD
MIETEEPETAIVFANTRNDTALVAAVLNRNGYDAELLNGDLPQKERERVMAKVKRGEVRFMVATDIAARGIDISDLSHVINYSLPEDPAIYLHRVGRTGRIGKKGTAISLVSGAEMMTLKVLQTKYGIDFEERKLPTPDEARQSWTARHVAELKEAMSSSIYEGFIPLAQELRQRPGGDLLVAFALKYFFTNHRIEKVHDREKAEHKKEERVRRETGAPPRESRDPRDPRSRRDRPRREARPHGDADAPRRDVATSAAPESPRREPRPQAAAGTRHESPRREPRPPPIAGAEPDATRRDAEAGVGQAAEGEEQKKRRRRRRRGGAGRSEGERAGQGSGGEAAAPVNGATRSAGETKDGSGSGSGDAGAA